MEAIIVRANLFRLAKFFKSAKFSRFAVDSYVNCLLLIKCADFNKEAMCQKASPSCKKNKRLERISARSIGHVDDKSAIGTQRIL